MHTAPNEEEEEGLSSGLLLLQLCSPVGRSLGRSPAVTSCLAWHAVSLSTKYTQGNVHATTAVREGEGRRGFGSLASISSLPSTPSFLPSYNTHTYTL